MLLLLIDLLLLHLLRDSGSENTYITLISLGSNLGAVRIGKSASCASDRCENKFGSEYQGRWIVLTHCDGGLEVRWIGWCGGCRESLEKPKFEKGQAGKIAEFPQILWGSLGLTESGQ